jgi:putative two-component system response regulator
VDEKDFKVLIVDDEPRNLRILEGILFPLKYTILTANNGIECLQIVEKESPDIILLDVMMPKMDGYEVCKQLKLQSQTAKIPVIFVTALNDIEDEAKGFALGAVDFINKPVSTPIVRARVKAHLALYNQKLLLEQMVWERTSELVRTQSVTILGLATLAEYRDNETGGHILRTQEYIGELTEALQNHPDFRDYLDENTIGLLYKSAPLHDIGKVGVRDEILLKPGRLSEDEFEKMKLHAIYGRDAIMMAEASLETDESNSFLRIAREMTYTHHEKWDGSGYPQGLSGTAIPVSGRLMAIADVYDALISKRVYKPPFSHAKAVEIMKESRGTQFDPAVLDAFLESQGQFRTIALKLSDSEEEKQALE